ncbi:MAG: TusE/DsrC/DsvC family sulfur relay protein [Gammaproteobacteria bacterium]
MSVLDSVERTANGYLVNSSDWNEEIATALFAEEGITPTDRHREIVNFVREETLAGNEPNERTIMKEMGKRWGEKVTSKLMYEMFPLMPSKQGLKIGGCPQSTRKGGY